MASVNYKCALILLVMGAASLSNVTGTFIGVTKPEHLFCIAAPDPIFCATLVRGARTGIQATSRAIATGIAVCKRMQPYITKFFDSIPNDIPPALRNNMFNTCNNDYQEVLQNYLAALKYLYTGDMNEVTLRMSSQPMERCLTFVASFRVEYGISIRIDVSSVVKFQVEITKYVEYTSLIASTVRKNDLVN